MTTKRKGGDAYRGLRIKGFKDEGKIKFKEVQR